ncbi:hypothetical protein BH09SUM1_BH09SUM1_07820 [soil metagenome]
MSEPERDCGCGWKLAAGYIIMAACVCAVVIPTWGWTYWDFGDGNYLYVARRVSEGAVLYKDIMAPQPPLHTIAGVAALWCGKTFLHVDLWGVRLYSLLCRLIAGALVMLIARRFFRCNTRALTAAAIYFFLPIGFWWSLSYESENLEIVFLLAALLLMIGWKPKQLIAAGICSALACHCNMTAVPYLLVNCVFLAFRKPRLLLWYLLPALGVYSGGALIANAATDGAFLSNVLFNQVGTFPKTEILNSSTPGDTFLKYAYRKITAEGGKVLQLEGAFIIAALAGIAMSLKESAGKLRDEWLRAEFLCWSAVGLLLSICFTAKGGTVNYIFVLGEPAVALFGAHAAVALWKSVVPVGAEWRRLSLYDSRVLLRSIALSALIGAAIYPSAVNIGRTLNEEQTELSERRVMELRALIETYAEPGDTILAPPFYAFLTKTKVAAELAENYIWQIKWMDEQFHGTPADGTAKMQELAALLREGKAKVVLLDTRQTGTVPEIRDALKARYVLAEPKPYLTRNVELLIYVPNDVTPHHPPLSQ